MIIDQLIAIPSPQSDDELPIERGQLTYKIKWSDLAGNDIGDLQSDMTTAQGDITALQSAMTDAQGDITDLQSDMTTAQGQISTLETAMGNVILQAARVDVSAAGTTTHTLTGLTENHVVASWGMFTDSTLATAIPENAPTCDITITTGADSWTLLIENYSAAFSIRPTFVLKQN